MCEQCPPGALNHASLHSRILAHFVEHGHAPSTEGLASLMGQSREAIVEGLKALADYHGVVLHPHEPEVWVCHPFATTPTNFWVQNGDRGWWGNCAWCSLGIAALLEGVTTITTNLGGEDRQVTVHILNGEVAEPGYFVHFPVPMTNAWDNVIFTCSCMLLFDSVAAVDSWCSRHRIPRGDVQSLENAWAFARAWYGRHLDANWEKWTASEAVEIFRRFGLTGPTWELPGTDKRF